MKINKKVKVSDQEQAMINSISDTFNELGINSVQFGAKGKTFIDTKKKKLMKKTK